jgi:light-regulated signal transduction histidine kinase (bacteriophytochrome)
MQRPDAGGRPHWVSISGQPLFDDAGHFAGYCGIGSDITERKLAQQALANINAELDARVESRTAELAQANEALQRSNMELQRFAYIASHDLKTPLRSIHSFAQLLERSTSGKLDAQAADWMRRIVANSQRMDRMLEDALAYTRIDSRAQPFARVELPDVCGAALGWLRESVQSSGAQISCGALPAVLGDTQQLTQLFQNLIGNAILYCGEAAPKIEISAREEDGHHIISVHDWGLGIEAGHQQRIFDMFYRLQTRQGYPGTGIGLAVCQRIVHRHRGRIWVASEPGKGSTFCFTLPMLENGHDGPV